jgi:hypothetical protein
MRSPRRTLRFLLHDRRVRSIAAVAADPLLDNVSQLVRDDPSARLPFGRIFASSEDNVEANCIGPRIDTPRREGRLFVGMNTHLTEIISETRLEKGPRCSWQWQATALPLRVDMRRQAGRYLRSLSSG